MAFQGSGYFGLVVVITMNELFDFCVHFGEGINFVVNVARLRFLSASLCLVTCEALVVCGDECNSRNEDTLRRGQSIISLQYEIFPYGSKVAHCRGQSACASAHTAQSLEVFCFALAQGAPCITGPEVISVDFLPKVSTSLS